MHVRDYHLTRAVRLALRGVLSCSVTRSGVAFVRGKLRLVLSRVGALVFQHRRLKVILSQEVLIASSPKSDCP